MGRSRGGLTSKMLVKFPGPWAYVVLRREYDIANYVIAQRAKLDGRHTFSFTFFDNSVDINAAGFIPKVGCFIFFSKTAVEAAAKTINFLQPASDLRQNWLSPPELGRIEKEVVPGFPDRILPINQDAGAILRGRTLTNLYNERPTWLANAHADLDAAVAQAYGWPADISEEDALARLFVNQERAARSAPGELLAETTLTG